MDQRIHHHYDLITVAKENVKSFPTKSVYVELTSRDSVSSGPTPAHTLTQRHTHTRMKNLPDDVIPHAKAQLGTFAGLEMQELTHTHTQITQIHAQSQSHTPTHNKTLWSL